MGRSKERLARRGRSAPGRRKRRPYAGWLV